VTTTSDTAIAYGGLWESSKNEKEDLLCTHRDFLRSRPHSVRCQMAHDMKQYITPARKGTSLLDRVLQEAGRLTAIRKGGSTRRNRDGRKRQRSHLTMKKNYKF